MTTESKNSQQIVELRLYSHDARRLENPNREARDSSEQYCSQAGEILVFCSTNEREEFERETGSNLTSDMPSAVELSALIAWLTSNAALHVNHCGLGIRAS